jgi:DnaJ-class molecular chaperone
MDRESKTRSTAIRIQYVCDDCVGHGYVPVSDREVNACPKCEGTGLTSQPVVSGWYDDVVYVKGQRYVRG